MSRVAHHQPAYADLHGQFLKSYHLEMVADQARVAAIRAALGQTLSPEQTFCEVGCGTGIFTIEAARHCSRVYAVELDPAMTEIARRNIEASGLSERIRLLSGDAMTVRLPERVDVVLCEMMSIWAIEEPQVPVANRIRRELLKPGGLLLPCRIVNLAELGYYPFDRHGVSIPAVMPLFTGVARPQVMTESRCCRVLDFKGLVDLDLSVEARFEALSNGVVNCAVLRSIVQMGTGVAFSGSDSLMPPTVVPLERPVEVYPGTFLDVRARLRARSSLEESIFMVEEVDKQ